MKYQLLILFVLAFLSNRKAFCQNPRFEHLSVEQGLSQASGYATVQDNDGFLWFATQDGLNRYDGYSFLVFRNNTLDSTSLVKNNIATLFKDNDGLIWVGTTEGLDILDSKTGKFYRFHQFFKQKNKVLHDQNIRKIFSSNQKIIWILTWDGGVYSFQKENLKISSYFPNERIKDICADKWGNIWIASANTIFKYVLKADNFIKFDIRQYFNEDKTTDITAMLRDKEDNLWIGSSDMGIFVFDTHKEMKLIKQFLHHKENEKSLSGNKIYCMYKDKNHHIWIGTRGGGLSRYIADNQYFTQYYHSEYDVKSLAKNFILSLYEDIQGIIWIGSSGGGFDKYDPKGQQFIHLKKDNNKPNTLSDNMIFSIKNDSKGNIYLGTQSGGLNRINSKSGVYDVFYGNPDEKSSALHNIVYDSAEDQYGNIWLATWGGLCLLTPDKNRSNPFRAFSDALIPSSIFLYQLHKFQNNDILWVAGQNGLIRFNIKEKKWIHWEKQHPLEKFQKAIVRVFLEDKNGNLWMGTEGKGLLCYKIKDKRVLQYTYPDLPSNTVRSIALDTNNLMWVGTDNGLVSFNTQTDKKNIFQKTANGLPNNVIYSILTESDNVWVATNFGISCFNKTKKIFKNYDINDGLQSNEFNTNAAYKSPEGLLYFGGINGISVFDPKSLLINTYQAPVKITNLKIFDKEYLSDTLINHLKHIYLSYRQNFFTLEFSSLNYSMTGKNKYAYQLIGIDADWVFCGTRRIASYTNLPSGDYTFRVKSVNNDGVWGKEISIKIHIIPPFWERWWFRLASLLFTIGLIYGFYHNRIQMLHKEANFKQKMAEVEMAALRSQMNPHFIFNCLNSINHFVLLHDSESASKYLTKFAQLIRLILENARSQKVSLEKELAALRLYIDLEALRFDHQFEYQIDVDSSIDGEDVWMPPLILQPYVENAIWHGLMHKKEKGKLWIKIKRPTENILSISIEDNGIGRQKAKELKSKSATLHKSFGMQITSDRIQLVNHLYKTNTKVTVIDLKDENNNACGTIVEMFIEI